MMRKTLYFLAFALLLSISLCACIDQEPDLEMLADPQNIRVENRVITWDPVENASGYLVVFDNVEYRVTENSFNYYFVDVADTYTFSVMALGDGKNYGNSVVVSDETTIKPPVKSGSDKRGFKYTYIEDIGGYEISAGKADLSGVVVLPDYFGDWPVKQIASRMFKHELAYTEMGTMPDCFTEQFCNKITTAIQLPAYLESIGRDAFAFILYLEEIEIPDTVDEIGTQAFEGCKRLKKVVFPSNLKEIPSACFRNTALAEVILPKRLERIGGRAFSTPETKYSTGELFGGSAYGHIDSEVSEIVIPASVKEIAIEAFYGRRNLKTVILEEKVEYMGTRCFHDTAWFVSQPDGLVYLKDFLYGYAGEMPENMRIEIPAGTKGICPYAFTDQENLCEVVIPEGVDFWGEGIFSKCSSLTNVSLPADIKSIPNSMFAECTNLKSVTLPKGITNIGICAFDSSGLESITLPSTVTSIEGSAFAYCEALKEIILPVGVEVVAYGFIEGCSALETLLIPASVRKIESYPFWECEALTYIFYEGSSISELETVINNLDFETLPMLRDLPIYYYSETAPIEGGLYWHYVDGKPTSWE